MAEKEITLEEAKENYERTKCCYCNEKFTLVITIGNAPYCGKCMNKCFGSDTAMQRTGGDKRKMVALFDKHDTLAEFILRLQEADRENKFRVYEIPEQLAEAVLNGVSEPYLEVLVNRQMDVLDTQMMGYEVNQSRLNNARHIKKSLSENDERMGYTATSVSTDQKCLRIVVKDELWKYFRDESKIIKGELTETASPSFCNECIKSLPTHQFKDKSVMKNMFLEFFAYIADHVDQTDLINKDADPVDFVIQFVRQFNVQSHEELQDVEEEKFQEKTTVKVKPLHVPKPKKHKISWLELRAMINNWHIDSKQKYVRLVKKGILKGAPKDPSVYDEFKGWNDFLAEKSIKSVKKTPKQLSKDQLEKAMDSLKANWSFYETIPDGWFYEVFDMWGLFKSNDPYYNKFFNQFIALRQTPAGRQQLFEAISEKNFDMIAGHYPKGAPSQTSIALFESTNIIAVNNQTVDPALLRSDKEIGVHKILSHAENIFPISEDDPVFDLHKSVLVKSLWTEMFESDEKKEQKQWAQIMAKRKSGKDTLLKRRVIQQFRAEYTEINKLRTNLDKCEYRGARANLMQVYVAYMLKKKKGFCNFSRTGTGKTKSAIISSRITKSKRTIVLCPKAIDEQWKKMIIDDYPESTVSVGNKKIFPPVVSEKDYRYHVINYEKFSYDKSADKIIEAVNAEPVDLVIVDEAQNIKQRIDHTKPDEEFTFQDQKDMSARKRNVEKMVNLLRAKNPKCKMLVLTATPVINNVTEGAKLLELVAGNRFDNLNYENTVRNASRLYTEFKEYSIRYNKKYNIKENKGGDYDIKVNTTIPSERSNEEIRKMHYSTFEQMCTVDRIPEMIKIAKDRGGKIIIYTDYVTGIVEPIKEAFELETNPATDKKFRVGLYTGKNKSGLKTPTAEKNVYVNPFQHGDLDILIASTPIAEGVDGLQHVCNTLIFNGLTWTFAKYEQIVGRLVRTGQRSKEVNIYRMLSSIEGYEYDQKIKVDRLHRKQLLQECVLDGRTPDLGLWDKQTAKEKREMLESVILNRQSRVRTKNQIRKDIRAGRTA